MQHLRPSLRTHLASVALRCRRRRSTGASVVWEGPPPAILRTHVRCPCPSPQQQVTIFELRAHTARQARRWCGRSHHRQAILITHLSFPCPSLQQQVTIFELRAHRRCFTQCMHTTTGTHNTSNVSAPQKQPSCSKVAVEKDLHSRFRSREVTDISWRVAPVRLTLHLVLACGVAPSLTALAVQLP